MEELLQKHRRASTHGVSFFRHDQNRLIKPRTCALGQPYLINIFLISCSPAELIFASVDKTNVKLFQD